MTDPTLPPQEPAASQPQQPYTAAPAAPLAPDQEKLWASLAHFGGIISFLPALLIFLILKDRSAHVREESKEALNFQITAWGAWIILGILSAVLGWTPLWPITLFIGFVQFAIWVVVIVFSIIAGVKVTQGGSYRYPFALRLIK